MKSFILVTFLVGAFIFVNVNAIESDNIIGSFKAALKSFEIDEEQPNDDSDYVNATDLQRISYLPEGAKLRFRRSAVEAEADSEKIPEQGTRLPEDEALANCLRAGYKHGQLVFVALRAVLKSDASDEYKCKLGQRAIEHIYKLTVIDCKAHEAFYQSAVEAFTRKIEKLEGCTVTDPTDK